jgi:hypothetical protein
MVPHHPRTHRVTRRHRRIELDSAVSVAVLYPAACCEVVVIDLRLRTLRRGPEVGDPVRTPEGPLVWVGRSSLPSHTKTAGDQVGAVGLEPTTVLPCKWHVGSMSR